MPSKAGQFMSRFTPVECAMKAQAAIVAEDQVVGIATDTLVLIRKLQGNMFQTVLRARLKQEPEGTAIAITSGMDRIVLVFCLMFLAAFAALCLAWSLAYVRVFQSFQFSDEDRRNYLFVLMPFICTLLGFGLVQLGRYASRDEAPFLTRLFVEATDAKLKKAVVKTAPKIAPKEPAKETA